MTAGSTGERLPSGRRSRATRSRDDVSRHQRARMLAAMTAAAAESGYSAVTVSDVITRAGVSRATFYEQFTDREQCFLAAFDHAAELLLSEVLTRAGDGGGQAQVSIPVAIGGYLDALVRNEHLARVLLIDSSALGPEGVRRRAAIQQRIAAVLARIVGARDREDLFACDAVVAAVGSMVTARLADGDLDGIRQLGQPIRTLVERLFGGPAPTEGPAGRPRPDD